jgi:GNAT superfamily N-acetyltransferase
VHRELGVVLWGRKGLESTHIGSRVPNLGPSGFYGEIVHGCEIVGSDDTRLAWAYGVERQGVLEVEELFVMPEFRRRKYGHALADSMREVAAEKGARLKFWISHADTDPENLAAVERLLRPLGLHVESSAERWASYFFTSTS